MNKFDLAYLAGFIDGEGCFSITSEWSKEVKTHKLKRARIFLGCTNFDAMDWISLKLTNLGIRHVHCYSKNSWKNREFCKNIHSIQICHLKSILKFTNLILPYLKVKHSHAELMIEYCKLRLSKQTSKGGTLRRYYGYGKREDAIESSMKNLNRKGIIINTN